MRDIHDFLENINCPICNISNFKVVKQSNYRKFRNFDELLETYKSSGDEKLVDQLVQCNSCALNYLNPRIKSSYIQKAYEDNIDTQHISQDQQRYKTFQKSFKKIKQKLKLNNLTHKSILDIGSASGIFLKLVKEQGFIEYGFEPSKWMSEFGQKEYNVNLKNGSINNVSEEHQFDLISFWDVLEHVTDLEKTIKKITKISKKNSYIIINVPAIDTLACRLMGKNWPFYLNVHLYYFTKNTISKLFYNNNFDLVYHFPHWQYLELGYILKRAENYFKIFKLFRLILSKLNLLKLSIPYNLGQTTFIFKKNV